jgi:hypothetical protein
MLLVDTTAGEGSNVAATPSLLERAGGRTVSSVGLLPDRALIGVLPSR